MLYVHQETLVVGVLGVCPPLVILCVPTPFDARREPGLSFVINTLESLLPYLKTGQIISLASTTYSGAT